MEYLHYGIGVIFLFLGFCLCYRNIFLIHFKRPMFFVPTLAGVIILTEIRLFTTNYPILIETAFFCCIIGIIVLAESNKLYVVALYPIVFMFYGSVNILCSYVLCFVLKIPYKEYVKSDLCEVLTNFITFFLFLLIYFFGSRHNNQKEIQLKIGEYFILLISVVCSFIVVAISQSLMEDDETLFIYLKQPFAVSVTALGFIMITGLLWISFLKNKSDLYKAENASYKQFMDKQESHVKDVVEADNKLRSFRHDINTHISALEACLNRRDYDALEKYLVRMKQNSSLKSSDLISGYAAVDAIVGEWHEKADTYKIRWNWKGKFKANLKVDLFDLCVLMANLLSNAVEAAEKVENEENRFIDVNIGSFHGRTLILVSNSCIDETTKNKELLTSKADKNNHGFGIKNIKRIVDDNNGEISFKFEKNVFKIEVIV